MLASTAAARATATARLASRRTLATAADSAAGYKVAAINHGQPTSAVTFIVKAGSRFETKPGVAHALKNFAFKDTATRSALRTVREAELYGGVLSSTLGREHLALTAEFLPGDEAYFVEVLANVISSTKFTPHEFNESVSPSVQSESAAASTDPVTQAIDLAHSIAFRSGLGSPLLASPHSHVTLEDVKSFASSVFNKDNIVVLGTGIDSAVLSKLVEKNLKGHTSSTKATSSPASRYFGGETRVLSQGHGHPTIFIGYGTTGASSTELATLAAYLDPTPSLKWSQGSSPLASLPGGATAQVVYQPYSDAALFGIVIQAPTEAALKEAGQKAVAGLKNLKGAEVHKAVGKAKFAAASALDARDGLASTLGPQLLSSSSASVDSLTASFDKVSALAISSTLASLTKAKPTYVAVGGNVAALPYADELGL
jgi:ubiquinol-cytochrome c reductase core subunit 2